MVTVWWWEGARIAGGVGGGDMYGVCTVARMEGRAVAVAVRA